MKRISEKRKDSKRKNKKVQGKVPKERPILLQIDDLVIVQEMTIQH